MNLYRVPVDSLVYRALQYDPAPGRMPDRHIHHFSHAGSTEDERIGHLHPKLFSCPATNFCSNERVDGSLDSR